MVVRAAKKVWGTPILPAQTNSAMENLPGRRINRHARILFASLVLDTSLAEMSDIERATLLAHRLREVMGCVTQAILWMHSKEIMHRDLQPANILLRPGEVFLTDFGISRDRGEVDRSTTDYYAGFTQGYAPPEVVSGDMYNASQADVYSLGCVFMHILTVLYPGAETYLPGYPPRAAQ